MSNIVEFHGAGRAVEEAGAWIVRLDSPAVTAADVEEFLAWRRADPRHAQAFAEMAALWDGLDRLSLLSDMIPLDAPGKAAEPARPIWRWAAAATVAAVAVGLGVWFFSPSFSGGEDMRAQYRTPIGGQKTVVLADGSVVQLNTNTALTVDYNGSHRDIWLKTGEAHFEVAKDRSRPFVVHAGHGAIRAVGTSFNVYVERERVAVTVIEGKVEVLSRADAPPLVAREIDEARVASAEAVALSAGQKVAFTSRIEAIDTVTPDVLDRQLAWQRGMLIFEGVPIRDAVKEISRYTETRILIEDPRVESIRVGGYFRSGAIEDMLEVFENSFGIEVTRTGDRVVVLTAKPEAEIVE